MYINEYDYEQYCFLLPSGSRFGKNKNRFIREQLAKQHPCYSDSCCYDFKYELLRGKIAARVVVMEKSVLARYRMNKKGKNLVIKNVHTSREERVFQSGARFFAYIPALLLLVLVPAFLPRGEKQFAPPVLEADEEFISVTRALPAFFSAISQENGRVTSFEYFYGQREEKTEIGVAGVYPESIAASAALDKGEFIVFSPIAFNGQEPSFSFVISKSAREGDYFGDDGFAYASSPLPRMRNAVLNAHGVLVKEDSKKNELGCFVPFEHLSAFLIEMENLRRASNLIASNARITCDEGRGGAAVQVSFLNQGENAVPKNENTDFSFAVLSGYAQLFVGKKSDAAPQKKADTAKAVQQNIIPDSYKKIGAITKNGSVVTEFFKTAEGKIIRRDSK
jgi:hypothetical protein